MSSSDHDPLGERDAAFMREALALAAQGIGLTDPNPRVGAVITSADGRVIGRGHTQEAGGPHAEVMAMRDALAHGEQLAGATAYVTLEPCAHHGRTPPCCDALVKAGIARVFSAMSDPNPLVAGQGVARMRAAGVDVIELAGGPLQHEAAELNVGFFARMRRGTPWVRLKVAVSLDGRTALPDGTSQWITGEAARTDGHAWRKRAGAVITGVGTVLDDNPRMDVRLVPTARQPLRVIVDSRLRTPPSARILEAPGRALIYTADGAAPARAALEARGAEVVPLADAAGRVDLGAVLRDLGERGINELHVEAGAVLNGAFVQQRRVDEFLVYMAPLLVGPGRDFAALEPLSKLQDGLRLRWSEVTRLGADLRLLARVDAA
jgi:diaminohydroxyphosphoribosylaminopyrimidine deaminase / 5-amino-6-(5-phosphoribosylamino)uracil reductase